MTDVYLVQFFGHQRTHDDVKILSVYRNLDHARQFTNNRFAYYLTDHYSDLSKLFFPNYSRKLLIQHYLKRIGLDQFTVNRILSYTYPFRQTLQVGQPIPNEIYGGQTVEIKMTLENCYQKLMELQRWITDRKINFPNFVEIPIILNKDVFGMIHRISLDTCRLKIQDLSGQELPITLYLGYDVIDLEDCQNRESHYCHSFRIFPKMLKD